MSNSKTGFLTQESLEQVIANADNGLEFDLKFLPNSDQAREASLIKTIADADNGLEFDLEPL